MIKFLSIARSTDTLRSPSTRHLASNFLITLSARYDFQHFFIVNN